MFAAAAVAARGYIYGVRGASANTSVAVVRRLESATLLSRLGPAVCASATAPVSSKLALSPHRQIICACVIRVSSHALEGAVASKLVHAR